MTAGQVLYLAGGSLSAFLVLVALYVWRQGRPLAAPAGGTVFRASRLSRGNHLFPAQVLVTPTSVLHRTPQWIGTLDRSIHIAHVASVRIDPNPIFSDVHIETSGGTAPIACHGHSRRDAARMKQLIESYQSAYYRAPRPGLAG